MQDQSKSVSRLDWAWEGRWRMPTCDFCLLQYKPHHGNNVSGLPLNYRAWHLVRKIFWMNKSSKVLCKFAATEPKSKSLPKLFKYHLVQEFSTSCSNWIHLRALLKVTTWPEPKPTHPPPLTSHLPSVLPRGPHEGSYSNALFQNNQYPPTSSFDSLAKSS